MKIEMATCCVCNDILVLNSGNEYVCDCGREFCLDCTKADFSDSDDEDYGLCQFCTGNEATDEQLLNFALKRLGDTKEELLEDYRIDFVKTK